MSNQRSCLSLDCREKFELLAELSLAALCSDCLAFLSQAFPLQRRESNVRNFSAIANLTVRIALQKRIQHLQVTRDLFPRPPFSGQLVDILRDELIAAVRLSTL